MPRLRRAQASRDRKCKGLNAAASSPSHDPVPLSGRERIGCSRPHSRRGDRRREVRDVAGRPELSLGSATAGNMPLLPEDLNRQVA